MTLERTALSENALSPAVAKVTGASAPGPSRMMAARGLAPMGPTDLVTAVYQLSLDADAAIAKAAKQTAAKLPDNILVAALGSAVDARVIDFFAEHVVDKSSVVEAILLNSRTHDSTFVTFASQLGEAGLEILAVNQERLLRYPAIIEALYFNRAARMSTVDKAIELAVRNGLVLKAIPCFAEISANIMGTAKPAPEEQAAEAEAASAKEQAAKDALFAAVLAYGDEDEDEQAEAAEDESPKEEVEERKRSISSLSINEKIRLATLGNAFDRGELIRDSNRVVALAAIKSPGVKDQEVIKYAGNRGLSEDVIRYIADKREWLKNYTVKLALVSNPKCPLPRAMRFLEHMRTNDLRNLARSKGIPSALATAARRLAMKRG